MKTYTVTLSAMGAVTRGYYHAERIEEVLLFLSGEYPTYTIEEITCVPTLKL